MIVLRNYELYLPLAVIFGMVLQLDHIPVLNRELSMVWLNFILEFTEFLADLL